MDHEYIGQLLGFTLAHSASVVDTLAADQAMVPYAITFQGEEQSLVNFEADTQQQAVAQAQEQLAQFTQTADAWTYSQEGVINNEQQQVSVLYFKVWLKGMHVALEAYQAYSKAPFKLLGNVQVQNFNETGMQQSATDVFVAGINQGVDIHPTAAAHWDNWCSEE